MILATTLAFVHLVTGQDALPRRGALGMSFAPLAADQATKLSLKSGEGLVAKKPLPGLTGEKAGIKEGDIIMSINGKPVSVQTIGEYAKTLVAGKDVTFVVNRDGQTVTLTAQHAEKPRDPGNANYEVIYSHIVSNGKKMRTIITIPKKAGKHPGWFFIQGFSPISYDFTLETSTGDVTSIDGPLLFDIANSGYVTMRVEKPGVGDSEGGPFKDLDYTTELDIYRQALKQLKDHPRVDKDNVFIFGHSMGGSFGPMVAAENPVKGIAVYGTAGRTWTEYLIDTVRYQGILAGGSFEKADEEVRAMSQLIALVFFENKTVEEVKSSHPQLAALADAVFPGGYFNQKTLKFWDELSEINFASYWAKLDSHVLAVKGESDFVVYEPCHKLIADIINRKNPGRGTFKVLPESDHLFHNFKTEAESQRNFSKGKFNIAFSTLMKEWMQDVMKK